MALGAFENKDLPLGPRDLARVLGPAARHWGALISHVTAEYPALAQHWHFAGSKFGWSLRLKQKKRIVLYLIPQQGSFLASVVLGEKAVKAAHTTHAHGDLLAIIEAAPRYAEGRGIRVAVSTAKHVKTIQELLAFKMAS